MRSEVVVDTNVAVVANGKTPQAGHACRAACEGALLDVRDRRRVLLDARGAILEEYRRHLSPSGQPGLGDAFFKWLWVNQANPTHCRRVEITPDAARGYREFPDDRALDRFDRDDRVFVAVAIASREAPPILNASDTDWWEHRAALEKHGIRVEHLCPELMVG